MPLPELVAGAMMKLKLLGAFPPASSYRPATFSSDRADTRSDLRMLHNARLGRHITLTPTVDLHANADDKPRAAAGAAPGHSQRGGLSSVLFALQRHPVLSTLEKGDLQALSEAFEPAHFNDGETILERRAGDVGDDDGEGAWVVAAGRVRSHKRRGGESSAPLELVAEHAAGEMLGADETLSGGGHSESEHAFQQPSASHFYNQVKTWSTKFFDISYKY